MYDREFVFETVKTQKLYRFNQVLWKRQVLHAKDEVLWKRQVLHFFREVFDAFGEVLEHNRVGKAPIFKLLGPCELLSRSKTFK